MITLRLRADLEWSSPGIFVRNGTVRKSGGTQWAIHLLRYGSSDYCYGAMINLDMIEDRIAAGLTMDHALVAVGPETPCQEEEGDTDGKDDL